jgi:hypothetical protein
VDCIDDKGNIIADNLCYKLSKPKTENSCNIIECPKPVPYEWRLGHWEEVFNAISDKFLLKQIKFYTYLL